MINDPLTAAFRSATPRQTPLAAALAFARQIDLAAALDEAREWPLHEELYMQIGELAGGLGWDLKTKKSQTLAEILPAYCEEAAQEVCRANPQECSFGLGGNDPDCYVSGWLEDEMDRAHDEAATTWVAETRTIAGPMLTGAPAPRAAYARQGVALAGVG